MNAFVRWSREPHFDMQGQADETIVQGESPPVKLSRPDNGASVVGNREFARSPAPKAAQVRDFKVALELLEKASTGVDGLSDKVKRTESERDKYAEELDRYRQMERQWHRNMEGAKLRFDEMQAEILSLSERLIDETARATTSEAKLLELQEQLKSAEDRNRELESDCTAFHDTILETFGVGSQAYETLSSNLHAK